MTATGVVSVSRAVLAEELGLPAQRISNRILEATAAGLLIRCGGGHNGAITRYRALLPEVKVPSEREPTEAVKVPSEREPTAEVASGLAGTYSRAEGSRRAGTIRARAPLPTNPTPYTTARDVPPRTDRDRGTRGPPTEDAAATAERNGHDESGDYSAGRSRLAAEVEQGNHRPRARVNGAPRP